MPTFQIFLSKRDKDPVWTGEADNEQDAAKKANAAGKLADLKLKNFLEHPEGSTLKFVQKRGTGAKVDWKHANDIDTNPFNKKKESAVISARNLLELMTISEGGNSVMFIMPKKATVSEVNKKFQELQDEAIANFDGEDEEDISYSGDWNTINHISTSAFVTKKVLSSLDSAIEFCKKHVGKREAMALHFNDGNTVKTLLYGFAAS